MTNSRGISADTIAEHVLAVTLVLFRKLPLALREPGRAKWAQDADPGAAAAPDDCRIRACWSSASARSAWQRRAGCRALGARVDRDPAAARHASTRRASNASRRPTTCSICCRTADVVVLAAPQTARNPAADRRARTRGDAAAMQSSST